MKIQIATYADLGKIKNLKTADILPVINKFYKEGSLDLVVCRRNRDFYFKNTNGAVSTFLFFLIKFLEKISLGFIQSRKIELFLIDNYVTRLINDNNFILLHPISFSKIIKKSKHENKITIGIATTASPMFNNGINREEIKLLNHKYGLKLPLSDHSKNQIIPDYIIAISDFVKRTYVDTGFSEKKIFIAQTDIDLARFNFKEKNDKIFRVIYVAHTSPLKGLHYLLDAFKLIKEQGIELVIVGDFNACAKDLVKKYKEIIDNDSRIKYFGFTKKPEYYYNKSSVFILPSLSEGNPRVLMEAMACGLPIITTKNAKGPVVDGENGFVIPIRDSLAIKNKIEYFYNNSKKTRVMGQKSREIMESKNLFGDMVYEIFKEIEERELLNKKYEICNS